MNNKGILNLKGIIFIFAIIVVVWGLFAVMFMGNPNAPTSGSASFIGMAGLGLFLYIAFFLILVIISIALVSKFFMGNAKSGRKLIAKKFEGKIFGGKKKKLL